jgi:hypothetical protein
MPDFKPEIRTSLAALNLSPTREEEIVEELSQDLQERFEEAAESRCVGGRSEATSFK